MKTSLRPRRRSVRIVRGFTLIELLVVVGIIALLAGVAIPVTIAVIRKGHETSTRTLVMGVNTAVANYEADYNRLPTPPSGDEDPVKTDDSTDLTSVLLGQNVADLNPKQVRYLTANLANKSGRAGLVSRGGAWALMDDWGHPFCVLMDADYDQLLANPDAQNLDQAIAEAASPDIPASVAVFSPGYDGDAFTRDDITSWRR